MQILCALTLGLAMCASVLLGDRPLLGGAVLLEYRSAAVVTVHLREPGFYRIALDRGAKAVADVGVDEVQSHLFAIGRGTKVLRIARDNLALDIPLKPF